MEIEKIVILKDRKVKMKMKRATAKKAIVMKKIRKVMNPMKMMMKKENYRMLSRMVMIIRIRTIKQKEKIQK